MSTDDDGGRLLKAVQAIAIKPADAKSVVDGYRKQFKNSNRSEAEIAEEIGKKIISRYAKLAASSGAATSLAGVVPGIGTAIALVGGSTADIAVSLKLQVDMCMCLAEAYGHDLNSEDARQLSYLVAVGGALEQAGSKLGTKVASQAGVRMVRQYLKGAVLQALKEMFKKIGIIFTRKAVEKALPFGIGVVIGGSTNYILTRYVGNEALKFFTIDANMRASGDFD